MSADSLQFLFHPKSVAIVGASENPMAFGCDFMNHMLSYGYSGQIYPINPKQPEILGVKSYPDIEQVPGTVDYVISSIGHNIVPDLLTKCSHKSVKAIHILAGRASETGRPEAKKIDAEILARAKEYGIRVLGPNCLGVFCPGSGLAFGYDFPKQPGTVSALMQSGGNSTDLIHHAGLRGVHFSKVASYGNALDINEVDLLEYFSQDPETKIILCFIEGIRGDSRRFLELIRQTVKTKPVIVCKAGRTSAGTRSVLSHTASLAGSARTWEAALRQVGAIPARDVDELVSFAVGFSMLPPVKGNRIGLGGSGGGRGTNIADTWEENGFDVVPLPQEIRDEIKSKGSQLWDWVNNPADASIIVPGDAINLPMVLSAMAKHPAFDLIAVDSGEDPPFGKDHFIMELTGSMEGYMEVKKQCTKPFLAIYADRPLGVAEMDHWNYRTRAKLRSRLIEERVPFFPTVSQAATVVREMINYYQKHPVPA